MTEAHASPAPEARRAPHALFEASWEICNKVGGIHTVVATKARTVEERFGDDYICIGPWLVSSAANDAPFEPE
jgi:hypothetical protein